MNVDGTRHVLDFAADASELRSFAYVGTAYVAGERTGLIREDELAVGQGYRNTYEQSKAEAEALVRSRMDSLPGVILRPSIIVGDSRTGATSSFKMMYWPLKIYARGLWRTVPGYPDAVLDIVPVDFVAAAVARLTFDDAAFGNTVHLCAGPRGSATIQQIALRAAEYFHSRAPRFVDPKFFFAAIRPLLFLALWGRKRRVLVDGRAYRDYFTMRMQFDTTNAERLLKPASIAPPPVMDYLDRLFYYCVASDWGRNPVSAQ
jgi:nucleoside-diphosphate-sugar epimerase